MNITPKSYKKLPVIFFVIIYKYGGWPFFSFRLPIKISIAVIPETYT